MALRFFKTPINFVILKRAFFIQNFLYSKSRNRILFERINKFQFFYINTRVLHYKYDVKIDNKKPLKKKKNIMITKDL